LSYFNKIRIFSADFRCHQYQVSRNSTSGVALIMHTEGHDEAKRRFSQLCKQA